MSSGGETLHMEYLPSADVFAWFENGAAISSTEAVFRGGCVTATLEPIENGGYVVHVENAVSDYAVTAEFTPQGSVVWYVPRA